MGMMLDVWTRHLISADIRLGPPTTWQFEISGYSFTCVPLSMLTVDTPDRRRVVVPAGYTYRDFLGKNKWIALSLWMHENRSLGDRSVEFVKGADGRWGVIVAGFSQLAWTSGSGSQGRDTATPSELGCRDEGDPSAWSDFIDRPAGTWQPCKAAWSLEPVDARVSSRDTASPYHAEQRTTMVWGTEYSMSLLVDLVPAADIYSMRAADIPFTGWAAKAARKPARGTGSVLEYLLPRIFGAEPQVVRMAPSSVDSGNWNVFEPNQAKHWWTPIFGCPTILYLKDDLVGRGYAMRGNGIYGGSTDDAYTPHTELMRMTWDDSLARHVAIPAGTTLAGMLTTRVGTNRMFRVEIPLVDITWPSMTPANESQSTAYSSQRVTR